MITGIHILLTYQCTGECDHCFLHCGPQREGTFTLRQLRELLLEIKKLGSIDTVYFEGGEPFLFYAVLLELHALTWHGIFWIALGGLFYTVGRTQSHRSESAQMRTAGTS